MSSLSRLRFIAVPAALFCIAACSSSDDSAQSSATSTAESTAAVASASPSPSPFASFETHPGLTGTAASSLVADLGSGDQAKVTAQLVLPSDGTTIDPSVYSQLQALGSIAVDDSSFKQLSEADAEVYAKVGQDQTQWTLLLQWNGTKWLLADTLEGQLDLDQPPTSTSDADSPAVTSATTG